MKKNIGSKFLYVALVGLFLPFMALLFRMLASEKAVPEEQGLIPLPVIGEYRMDGGEWRAMTLENDLVEDGYQVISVRGHLSRAVAQNETVWFRAENVGIILRVNGAQVFACLQPGTFPAIFNSPGYGWYSFSSPGIAAEDTVELELLAYYGDSRASMAALRDGIYTGDGSGLFRLLLGQTDLLALIALVSIIAGWIYLLEGIIAQLQRLPEAKRILLMGFYYFSGGLWCVTDAFYPYFSLVISPSWLANIVDISGVMLFPIALVLLVRFYICGAMTRKIMDSVAFLTVMAVLVAVTLQLFGIADLRQQQSWLGGVALLLLGAMLGCIGLDLRRYRRTYLLLLLLSVVPAFVAIFLDCANLFFPFMPRRTMMCYGFSLSAALMVSQLVSYARRESEIHQKIQNIKETLLETRLAIMLSQIQPHFLFNTLLGIKQLCDTKPEKASDALEHFSYYLRGNLDSLSEPGLISFEKEMEHLQNYFYLEKMRFEQRVHMEWNVEYQDFLIPPLTLQPLVENAVRHGITKKDEGGTIRIQVLKAEGMVIITISDDGVGFDMGSMNADGRSHVGIENVRSRLEAQCGGSLHIQSELNAGTEATIILPQKEDGR